MKFTYSYESNDGISERMLREVEIFSWKCTPLLVNLLLKYISFYSMIKIVTDNHMLSLCFATYCNIDHAPVQILKKSIMRTKKYVTEKTEKVHYENRKVYFRYIVKYRNISSNKIASTFSVFLRKFSLECV